MAPYLSFESEKIICNRLVEVFEGYEHNGFILKKNQIINAGKNAWQKQADYHEDIRKKGREILEYVHVNKKMP